LDHAAGFDQLLPALIAGLGYFQSERRIKHDEKGLLSG
jgi:hypothetical protein